MVSGRLVRPMAPIGFGLLAGAGLLAFYLGVLTLAQGWAHAVQQLNTDRWFIAAIVAGFATQIGLFTYLRGMRARVTAGGLAAGAGTSGANFRIPLLWLGILMNLGGIAYLLYQIGHRRRMRCP